MRIKKLPKNLINILAAGEVVERPYSVVKELVENSLDAKADSIKIEIFKGGKDLIKVSDNGVGIDKEDLPLTIQEFATSKISSIEDLYNLHSFGFRGEALSSISSVSKFKIISKTSKDPTGWKLEKIDNKIEISPIAVNFSHGTEIYVKDLFFNLPVRRKFLKSEQTEFKYIQELIVNYAIKNYDKNFQLFHNDKLIFDYKAQPDLLSGLKHIYPESWAENYMYFEFSQGDINLYGVMGKSILKFNSSMIKIFVNGRPIKDKIIQKAIMQAYSRWIEPGMYPFVILFLDISPEKVDVNIHPRKEEVKFSDPGSVYNLVLNVLKNKLETPKDISEKSNYVDFKKVKQTFNLNLPKSGEKVQTLDLEFKQNIVNEIKTYEIDDIKIIGQIFDSYILFTKGEDFYIMDQHAVAERIIFEKMRKEYSPEEVSLLTMPLTFEVKDNISEKLEKLNKMGFDISYFGENKVILYAVPKVLEKFNIDFSNLVNNLLASKLEDLTIEYMLNQVLATKSCKAAIKANHKLSFEEMKQLVLDGQKYISGFFVCQHGRPSIVKLKKEDIDKFFDRK